MGKVKGLCTNYDECESAENESVIELSKNDDFVCPECGQNLTEVKTKPLPLKLIIGSIVGVSIFVMVIFWGFYIDYKFPIGPKPYPTIAITPKPAPTPVTPLPKPTEVLTPIPTKNPYIINLFPITNGQYKIPKYFHQYVRYVNPDEKIIIKRSFSIQAGETTVKQFRRFYDELDEAEQKQIGLWWAKDASGKDYSENKPVDKITWKHAEKYTQWLSQKTKWDIRLPTTGQWIAACITYETKDPIIDSPRRGPIEKIRQEVDHLLGNLREFSIDTCQTSPKKRKLLGENYIIMKDLEIIGQEHCINEDDAWQGVGFRIIRIDE